MSPGQCPPPDDEADALAGQAHVVEQGGEVAGRLRKAPLLLDHEFGDGLFSSAHRVPPKIIAALLVFSNLVQLPIDFADAEHAAAPSRDGTRREWTRGGPQRD